MTRCMRLLTSAIYAILLVGSVPLALTAQVRHGGGHGGGGHGGRHGGHHHGHAHHGHMHHHGGMHHARWGMHGPGMLWHPLGFVLTTMAITAIVVSASHDDGGDGTGSVSYDQGVYYQKQSDGSYKAIPAPTGVSITTLPSGYTSVAVSGTDYAYYQGDYYVEKDGKYLVVAPPVGAMVPYVPDAAVEKTEGGTTYVVYDGQWYTTVSQSGDTMYVLSKVEGGSG